MIQVILGSNVHHHKQVFSREKVWWAKWSLLLQLYHNCEKFDRQARSWS